MNIIAFIEPKTICESKTLDGHCTKSFNLAL